MVMMRAGEVIDEWVANLERERFNVTPEQMHRERVTLGILTPERPKPARAPAYQRQKRVESEAAQAHRWYAERYKNMRGYPETGTPSSLGVAG